MYTVHSSPNTAAAFGPPMSVRTTDWSQCRTNVFIEHNINVKLIVNRACHYRTNTSPACPLQQNNIIAIASWQSLSAASLIATVSS
jgi:hypothetical protein